MTQLLNQQQAIENRTGTTSKSFRKARTRTLIQLGGLIEKAGLLEVLDLQTGQDLQKDPDTLEAAATLLGALLELRHSFISEDAEAQKLLWQSRGKEALAAHKPVAFSLQD